ncbi:MAG: DUF6785 family protein [Armatimonadota bacterium]
MEKASLHGATARAILLALCLMPLNALWVVSLEVVRYSGQPTTISIFYHVVFWLAALVLLNRALARLRPRWALAPGELLTIYTMLCLASALAGHDWLEVLIPILTHGTHFADEANRWSTRLLPHFPDWLIVRDREAAHAFYAGSSSLYEPRFLLAWATPVLFWSAFLSVLTGVMLLINLLFRYQWTQAERLSFPLVQIPLEMVGSALYRERLFWAGCLLAGGIDFWNGLRMFVPSLPALPVKATDYGHLFQNPPWNAIGWLPVGFFPFAIGIGYLLPVDLLFSCWFFFWYWKLMLVVSSYMGWSATPRFPYTTEQAFGGYMAIAVLVLLQGGAIWRRVRASLASGERGPGEPLPYRTVLGLLVVGLGLIWLLCSLMGMRAWVIALFLLIYLALSLAITRMRAELGPPAHDLHFSGPDHLLPALLTPQQMNKSELAAFTTFYGFNRAYRAHPMPFQMEGLKMAERGGFLSARYVGALWLACVAGVLVGFWANLHLLYHYGAGARVEPPFVPLIFGGEAWNRLDSWTNNPTQVSASLPAIGVGFGTALTLGFIRQRWTGFLLHPVGYAVSSSWSMAILWVPMLIAWVIKSAILRIGGLSAYRRGVPFFLGLIVGECVIGSLWSLIGLAFELPIYPFYPY